MDYFITGIDTDSGKTLVSAILCEAFNADYWKPIQSGLPRDSETVQRLVTNNKSKIHPERYLLKTPASPHAAAKIDDVNIQLDDFSLPATQNNLIVEGAGGCMVPLNDKHFVIDLINHLKLPVVLVADLYLGSINHTLLTVEALRNRKIEIAGIVFNGISNTESERIILLHSKLKCVLRINHEEKVSAEMVHAYAQKLKSNWNEL